MDGGLVDRSLSAEARTGALTMGRGTLNVRTEGCCGSKQSFRFVGILRFIITLCMSQDLHVICSLARISLDADSRYATVESYSTEWILQNRANVDHAKMDVAKITTMDSEATSSNPQPHSHVGRFWHRRPSFAVGYSTALEARSLDPEFALRILRTA